MEYLIIIVVILYLFNVFQYEWDVWLEILFVFIWKTKNCDQAVPQIRATL